MCRAIPWKGMGMSMRGDKLRDLRKEKNLTQGQLAKAVGVSASAIGMYEQNRREPNNETLIKLCRYFGVSSDDILLGRPVKSNQDIEILVDEVIESLKRQEGLMFNGAPVDRGDLVVITEALRVGFAVVINRLKHKDCNDE